MTSFVRWLKDLLLGAGVFLLSLISTLLFDASPDLRKWLDDKK
jgi:hypothetical protein